MLSYRTVTFWENENIKRVSFFFALHMLLLLVALTIGRNQFSAHRKQTARLTTAINNAIKQCAVHLVQAKCVIDDDRAEFSIFSHLYMNCKWPRMHFNWTGKSIELEPASAHNEQCAHTKTISNAICIFVIYILFVNRVWRRKFSLKLIANKKKEERKGRRK